MDNSQRTAILLVALVVIGGLLYALTDKGTAGGGVTELAALTGTEKEGAYPRAREIVAPSGFINSPHGDGSMPFTVAEYIGKKVVLVDFWTYSCINCIRTQPYLNAWYEKYEDDGLVIIGVHTPEFDFEKEYENVSQAVSEESIRYPVVLDNDYGTWRAYQNSYWPRKYLIDIDGYIVYDHIGEGAYEETERIIQKALVERGERLGERALGEDGVVAIEGEAIPDRMPRTPEIYFGAFRNEKHLMNGEVGKVGAQAFTAPESKEQKIDALYLDGPWHIKTEYAEGKEGSSIKLRYQGKKVFFVAASEEEVAVRVLLDGVPLTAQSGDVGEDVNGGVLRVQDEKLYRVIDSPEWGVHNLELYIEEGSLEAFTFTFG